jgi:outer membrane protein assembly factor BamD
MRQAKVFSTSLVSLFACIFLSGLGTIFLSSCSSKEKSSDTAEGAYAIAQEFDKDELWERAISKYQEVKNKYPYSKYATMAELAIADCHFKDESFPEAQVSYQAFKDLHPKHPQIDYVTHRLGLSFFKQLPSTIDRDLTLASSAILYFNEVINQYPNSPLVAEAKTKKDDAYKMLAQKEQYIADFYFKMEKFDSALGRYELLLKKYPGLGFDAKAMSQAAIAASRIGEPEKAHKYIDELEKRFANSDELKAAKLGVK